MSMRQHVERYVTQKQRLGLKYENEGKILRDYAQNADERGDDFVCSDAMIEWSAEATTVYAARRRLTTLRNFALWLRSEDRLHEVPPRGILGWGKKKRPAPHLLTWKQIRLIMDAALDLQPAGSIKRKRGVRPTWISA